MKKDGRPAFPLGKWMGGANEGMSLRDYFAAKALMGYRSAYHQWYKQVGATGKFADPDEFAKWSYADADAMLAEREKE